MFTKRQAQTLAGTVAFVAALGLALTGCTNTGTTPSSSSGTGAKQTVKASDGPTCSLVDYKGDKIDLKNAVVGFSQSEKEDNPFRIAETQ